MSYFLENNKAFLETDLYKQLQKDFKHVYADWRDFNFVPDWNLVGDSHRTNLLNSSICYYSVFVYLNLLLDKNPTVIADVGCGLNWIKKYVTGVVGFDKTPEADYQEFFDDDFVKNHYKEFDCALAVNSMHYIPPEQISYRIDQFAKTIKSGGRGLVTINPGVMLPLLEIKDTKTLKEYKNIFDNEVKKIKQKILVYDNFIPDKITGMFRDDYDVFKGDDWPSYENILNIFDDPTVTEDIKNEINVICISEAICDPYNGRIRIVFEVD